MVSVIIPVYNEPDGLSLTLESLVHQNISKDSIEIIVVDNGSADNTVEVARQYEQQHPQLIQVMVEDTVQGSYAARNKGVKAAKGTILCFIDADMTLPPDYLNQILQVFKSTHPAYVGCQVEVYREQDTLAAKYNQLTGFNVSTYLQDDHFVPTCCLSVDKNIFDQVGLFDPRLESGWRSRVWTKGI